MKTLEPSIHSFGSIFITFLRGQLRLDSLDCFNYYLFSMDHLYISLDLELYIDSRTDLSLTSIVFLQSFVSQRAIRFSPRMRASSILDLRSPVVSGEDKNPIWCKTVSGWIFHLPPWYRLLKHIQLQGGTNGSWRGHPETLLKHSDELTPAAEWIFTGTGTGRNGDRYPHSGGKITHHRRVNNGYSGSRACLNIHQTLSISLTQWWTFAFIYGVGCDTTCKMANFLELSVHVTLTATGF